MSVVLVDIAKIMVIINLKVFLFMEHLALSTVWVIILIFVLLAMGDNSKIINSWRVWLGLQYAGTKIENV